MFRTANREFHFVKPDEGGHAMKLRTIAGIISLCSVIFAGNALAFDGDCSGLTEWKRQAYYLVGDKGK
jgi:hypothetical protein